MVDRVSNVVLVIIRVLLVTSIAIVALLNRPPQPRLLPPSIRVYVSMALLVQLAVPVPVLLLFPMTMHG
jgi:hypothetical protein